MSKAKDGSPPPKHDFSERQSWGNWLPAVLGLGCAPGGETPQGVCCTCDEDVGSFQQAQAASPQRGAYAVHTFGRPWETPGISDYVPPVSTAENSLGAGQDTTVELDSERARLVAAEKGQRAKVKLEKASQDVKDVLKQVSRGACQTFALHMIWHM